MKKIYILLLALSFVQVGFSQSDKTKKADKLYRQLKFVDAAEAYLKIALDDADTYVMTQLANSYYYVFNTKEAERWYAKVIDDTNDPEIRYRYAQMLKANSKYDQANKQMRLFAAAVPQDSRAKEFLRNPDYIPELLAAEKKFEVKPVNINTNLSDFGGYFHLNTFYFTSARSGGRKYGWNEEPYLDIYKAQFVNDGFTAVEALNDKINTRYHEGTVAITDDGQTMYFARTNYDDGKFVKDSSGIGLVNLFKATMVDGDWDNVERLPFNDNNYTSQHPALSDDGKLLYFASDRPGGYGGSDLYKVSINEDGTFGTPVNLGSEVNTEGNEGFPFVDNGMLYFASNGHLGLGGLDLFVTEIQPNGGFGDIRNMGVPINSNSDDFSFSFESETKTGFFSSNREGGKGSDDIYLAKQIAPICDVDYVVTVVDKDTKEVIANARVALADAEGNKVATKTTDKDGKLTFKVECNKDIELEATATDYEGTTVGVKGTSAMISNVTVALDPLDKLITDKINLEPIYFDFDKYNIRKDAAFELDKLVAIMKKHPEITIRVETHTDTRGSKRYNQILSEKRAKSTVQYVISQGIEAERLTSKGFGEEQPKVECSPCTEEQHQENRRSDFIITNTEE